MNKDSRITRAYRASVNAANAAALEANMPYFTAQDGRIYANYAGGRRAVVGTTAQRLDFGNAYTRTGKSDPARRS